MGQPSLNLAGALRLAGRQFRQRPAFAFVVVLVLGLGTGAATTVFTAVDAVVLRPLPFDAPDRLVTLWDTNTAKGLAHDPISPVNFMDYRALPVFKDAAAWWRPGVNLADPGMDPVRVNTIEVSGNLFEVLGVRPQLGAGFPVNGPLFARGELVAVISDRLWHTRYSADPTLLGKQLSLSGTPYTIVGIMPPKFHYPDDVDVWQRLSWNMSLHSRAAHFMEAVARLKDDTTFDQAQGAVGSLGLRLQQDFSATNRNWSARLIPLLDEQLGYYRPALMVMFGAVGLLLVIALFNIASLLLTRALSRDREIAVRIALGAMPRQLVTQLLAESLVLSIAGAIVGLVAAAVTLPLILHITPMAIPRLEEARVDARALALAASVVVVSTLLFGLVPAVLLLKKQVSTELKAGARGSSRSGRAIYSMLVAGEVALACALLVSAALLVRTVGGMMQTPTGVDADGTVTSTVQLTGSGYPWTVVGETQTRILETIRQQPGVQFAGASNFLPLEVGWRNPIGLVGEPPPARPEDAPQVQLHSVTDGYFESMGAQMATGRAFTARDTERGAAVVIVNETLLARYFPNGPAVGRFITSSASNMGPLGVNMMRLRPTPPPGAPPLPRLAPTPYEIVGVVRDVRNTPLGQKTEPAVYFPMRQFPFREVAVTVRATDRAAAVGAIQTALRQVAPTVPASSTVTWGEKFARRTAEPRLLMTILMFFAALAAVLSALGIYGLFSWSVALRTRELAIRLTLGARPAAVGGLVLRQSAILVSTGLIAGLLLIRAGQQVLDRVLFGVTPNDPMSTLLATTVLVTAAVIACIPPALRAMRVDPVVGLRAE
jgi:putative ABC transport system permease protein